MVEEYPVICRGARGGGVNGDARREGGLSEERWCGSEDLRGGLWLTCGSEVRRWRVHDRADDIVPGMLG